MLAPQGRMVDFHFKGLQITKVKINCYFLDQVGQLVINLQYGNWRG